jgi:hypothetical protein
MPNIADLVVTDDDAEVNSRTFDAVMAEGGKGTWYLQDLNTIPAGKQTLSVSIDTATAKRATDRIKLNFAFPEEVTVDSQVVVQDTPRFTIEIVAPTGSSATEMTKNQNLVISVLGSQMVQDYIRDRMPVH